LSSINLIFFLTVVCSLFLSEFPAPSFTTGEQTGTRDLPGT
jgi:hypothetical protein